MPAAPLRIILTPVGSSGDVHPFVGVGRALKARGHDVTIVTAEPFQQVVERAGVTFVKLGEAEEFDRLVHNPDLWHPRKGLPAILDMIAARMRHAYTILDELVGDRDDTLLVGHSIGLAARMVEDKRGLRAATIHLAPSVFRSVYQGPVHLPGRDLSWLPQGVKRGLWWLVDRLIIDRHIEGPLNKWRAELGLPAVSRIFREWIHSPRRVIALFPEWFAAPQPDWPAQVRLTGFPLWDETGQHEPNQVMESFLKAGDPPIVFTPGSANRHAAKFFRAAVEAATRLGRRALLLTRYPEQVPQSLPGGVLHVEYAPFSEVLPRCAAIVHHGGIGTSAQGLAAGIPQLVMPLGFDQPDNVARLSRLGVGDFVTPGRFKGRRVATVLNRLLTDPGVRVACEEAKRRIDPEAALTRTCELIEELAVD